MRKIELNGKKNSRKILKIALNSHPLYDFVNGSINSKFSCTAGCSKCCGYTYYLPGELDTLPGEILDQLIDNEGIHEIRREEKRCMFYDSSNDFFCTIHDKRPLRCRIYPYIPLIVNQRIIITLEPAIRMMNSKKNDSHDCPGIGIAGSKTMTEVTEECTDFLKMLSEAPETLITLIQTQDSFNRIRDDKWFMKKSC